MVGWFQDYGGKKEDGTNGTKRVGDERSGRARTRFGVVGNGRYNKGG